LTKGLYENADVMLFLFEQGIEENVELCTMLGREAEELHGRSKEIIRTKPGDPASAAG